MLLLILGHNITLYYVMVLYLGSTLLPLDVQGRWVLSWSSHLSSAAASSSFAFKDVTK